MTVSAGEVREVTMTDSDKVVDGHADDPQNVCDSFYPRLNVFAISKFGLFHDGLLLPYRILGVQKHGQSRKCEFALSNFCDLEKCSGR